MTGEHLDAILKEAQAKAEKDGFSTLPEGSMMTLHVAHDGAGLNIPRIERVKVQGDLVFARNARKEVFTFALSDLFAVALEGTVGQPVRRAGFG